ncbi:nickel-dependent hydrogenase large subunit [Hydrogenivirga sp. 128-5-R1-1]|uniref:nickel-dependent hydrogenase large subunit n=1 Tax=Hydrogenivirga sp. 128-5-R1-1 TaxID=392423 RepID=UPI00015EF7D3|nr:nickel-dependent hydrogenase large subunit [Hydrogenivirga sp. 128-5-R1-1]EDP75682.1 hydrogenase large subunit [Hydrogenivirga sp. 128-5-R1-1]
MKIERKVLNRVEGEIELKLLWKSGRVDDAFLCAMDYRGFERLLKGKPFLDALVIVPRVCGICGHAHLMACVKAIEDAYSSEGYPVQLSDKALEIRKLTLMCEMLQNHLRWFYMYLLPDIVKLEPSIAELYEPLRGRAWVEALRASNMPIKVIALFGGQWPHTSYAVPGGVVCDPTGYELSQAELFLERLKTFFESWLLGMPLEEYLSLKGRNYLKDIRGDLGRFTEVAIEHNLHEEGRSYDRFITGGELKPLFRSGFFTREGVSPFDADKVSENDEFTFFRRNGSAYTWSKAARYSGLPCETGPLARQLVSGNRVIGSLFRRFGSSVLVRVVARMDEAVRLFTEAQRTLHRIKLDEPSWNRPSVDEKVFSGRGVGVVEAARGTLIHELEIEGGRIRSYNIITPTVWNLGPRDAEHLGVAERALLGLDSELKAEIVVRSFDVCSVCTTH